MNRIGLSLVILLTSSIVMAEGDVCIDPNDVTEEEAEAEYNRLTLNDFVILCQTIQIAAETIKPPTVMEKKNFRELVFRIMGQQGLPHTEEAVLSFESVVMENLVNEIAAAKAFYSDAIISIDTGKVHKSEARKNAEDKLLEARTIDEEVIIEHQVVMSLLANGVLVQLRGRDELTRENIENKLMALKGCFRRIHKQYFLPIIAQINGRTL